MNLNAYLGKHVEISFVDAFKLIYPLSAFEINSKVSL